MVIYLPSSLARLFVDVPRRLDVPPESAPASVAGVVALLDER